MTTRLLILDLDGTLYSSKPLNDLYERSFEDFVAREISADRERLCRSLLGVCSRFADELAYTPSRLSLLPALGVAAERWFHYSAGHIDPRMYLGRDDELERLLSETPTLNIVCTNNCAVQAERTIEALGIGKCIHDIVCAGRAELLKPSAVMYEDIVRRYGIGVEEAMVIGDRKIDIIPAMKLGMPSILIGTDTIAGGRDGCLEAIIRVRDGSVIMKPDTNGEYHGTITSSG